MGARHLTAAFRGDVKLKAWDGPGDAAFSRGWERSVHHNHPGAQQWLMAPEPCSVLFRCHPLYCTQSCKDGPGLLLGKSWVRAEGWQPGLGSAIAQKSLLFFFFFKMCPLFILMVVGFFNFLLKYSWFTMFQVYSKVIQFYIYVKRIYIFFFSLFHYRLLQDIAYSSLCYTVGPCCLFILHIVVCIC